ncbi:MAG: hypothetical protein RLZZ576_730, partial [Actinomycetota bacterium]
MVDVEEVAFDELETEADAPAEAAPAAAADADDEDPYAQFRSEFRALA